MGGMAKIRLMIMPMSIFTNTMARPVRRFLIGSTRPVAASGLESFEDLVRPLCPHAANGFRMGCEMHVHRKTDHGKVTWVFQASHGCEFMGELLQEYQYNLQANLY
jgi:hypothetical protein